MNSQIEANGHVNPPWNPQRLRALVEDKRVHRDVYSNKEVFALEMERIWARAWIYVGHESQVKEPGDYITTTIGLTPVIMVRDPNGEDIHVLKNRCGHRGAMVCEARWGKTNQGMFQCPYHGWTFRADGSLRSYPAPGGYKEVGFDKNKAEYGMLPVARVERYRGFVFASLASTGPDFLSFAGRVAETIDNMVDRAPDAEVEVTGKTCHRFRHPANWKFFTENLHDAMHPMIAHGATTDAVHRYVQTLEDDHAPLPEAEVIAPFGGSYDFFDNMGFTGLSNGHGFMGGKSSIMSHYEAYPDYLEAMYASHGRERTEEILSANRHNTLLYPSCTIRDNIQSIRVVIPVSVNETIIESWTFRLKGAPNNMLERTLRYSRLINSPGSMVGPDDLSCYKRIQVSAEAGSIEWIDAHRHHGRQEETGDGITTTGTSDFALLNQYRAWVDYMTADS